MKNWATTIKLAVKLYKWRLLMLALTLAILLVTKGNILADEQAKPPPGSVPTPNIDPL